MPTYNATDSLRTRAFRGPLLHCLRDPGQDHHNDAIEYLDDALLLVENGRVARLEPAQRLLPDLGDNVPVEDLRGKLIVPGFIDTHIHYPQTDMIASHGEQLLDWLTRYAFPTEQQFENPQHAAEVADFFIDELLRNGTTTALVLGTVHPQSADAIFESARRRGMRLLAGKVLMDRNCPDFLRDDPERGYLDSKRLIERWHHQDRLAYAITPRFAATSSDAQLQQAGRLASEHPDVYVHTHVAENRDEVEWVARLFPWSRSYLDVYEHYGLLRERSVFAHCIHLDDQDRQRMSDSGAAMAFCPTSNLFLGSGLFDLQAANELGIRVGLATDVGGGTSFSMLLTLNEAYKVAQMRGQTLTPARALYLATLGGARALYLDDHIGNLCPGKEADFMVLDPAATPLIKRRMSTTTDPLERFFIWMMLGDDRAVAATWLTGRLCHPNHSQEPAS